MTRKQSSQSGKIIMILVGISAIVVLLAVGGFAYAATQETHDPFCASCHTQPESTYYQRSIDAQSVDLASYHTTQETRCIDCHYSTGVWGRVQAEMLGARNAAAWYTHTAVQPARLTVPIQDVNCIKCHQDVTERGYIPKQNVNILGGFRNGEEEEGGANHWHEQLARWQAVSPGAGSCTSCHPGHSTDGSSQTGFQNEQTTRRECEACHQVLGEGRDD